ncbi:MAG: DUF1971 domain-containing protein [Actinobacteria bacterium]|nr:DUF1971 domain-containing protein [Actinomycetota bacterium]
MDDTTDPIEMPDGLELARTTDVFDETNHPGGLLRAHEVADGVWGRLVVHTGSLRFVFDDEADRPRTVDAGRSQVIPPRRRHHVELDGPVTFAIEFHRRPATSGPTEGSESTGLQP